MVNRKIKVLWFSNLAFSNDELRSTGTWLHTMALNLVHSDEVELYNISQGKVKSVTRQNSGAIGQWLVPFDRLKNGLPSSSTICAIQKVVESLQPDLIHIWGTENYWGLLTARGYIKGNAVLEIQGLKLAIHKYFYSGLSILDIIRCFGIKEFVKPSVSLFYLKKSYKKWGEFEKEMMRNHSFISTQSDWVRAYVRSVASESKIIHTSLSLRKEFIEGKKWDVANCVEYQIFTSSASVTSYKGLHILLDAVSILKIRFPQVKLIIGGNDVKGIKQGGYAKWLKKKIINLGIENNVRWIGSLDAKNMVLQMHQANVVVIPSFIESYCLALDEALTLGLPVVAAFSGAMPELAVHEKTALFFPPGDSIMCANCIERFFGDKEYSKNIAENAYHAKKYIKGSDVGEVQLTIYRNILKEVNE